MSELLGLYALWYREVKVFFRERSRIVSSVVNPLIWLIAFGGGLGASISFGGADYQSFIFPGVIMMTTLFSSIFFGMYIVWDKKIDFFKEVLVAPLSRTTLFAGKMLGGCTDALIQSAILIALGPLFGVSYTLFGLGIIAVFIVLIAAGATSLGLAIGAQMSSFEGFGLIQSFVVMPLFFLSGALYPIDSLPLWLKGITYLNPLTYAVDGMRGALLNLNAFPIIFDVGVAAAFVAVLVAIGTIAFQRMN
ncbi:MAG TPA: ABC transporter permease [Candidatus Methanomethylicus sp.]|nr:ABC transporter permease [Candidatus Methanomethylicus sp.]HRR53741.1 ABC transporter permease [Candidatus Methanomethylicus sp.]HRU81299.1 ABC transporter permease [Candidatus Methanomethylicus sp.]